MLHVEQLPPRGRLALYAFAGSRRPICCGWPWSETLTAQSLANLSYPGEGIFQRALRYKQPYFGRTGKPDIDPEQAPRLLIHFKLPMKIDRWLRKHRQLCDDHIYKVITSSVFCAKDFLRKLKCNIDFSRCVSSPGIIKKLGWTCSQSKINILSSVHRLPYSWQSVAK